MSSNQSLIPTTQSSTEIISVDKLNTYLDAMGIASKLNKQERTQFIEIAQAFNLNPFTREIYGIKYGNNPFQIVVGYEVYLKRAERSGQFDGVDTEFYKDGTDTVCQVTIHRKDWSRPLIHRVYLSEYNSAGNPLWKSKPKTMLRKVAVSQAYRMAFPCELGGMPYTNDELGTEVQETTAEVVQDAATAQTVEAKVTETAKPKMTKRQLAETAKEDARFKDYQKSIGICKDDQSYDYNEGNIANDEVLSNEQKASLIKESIMVRTAKVTYVEQAEVVKKRIGGWAKLLGTPDVTALLNDLIEQAAENGIKYENKKFYVPEPVEEVEAEEVNG